MSINVIDQRERRIEQNVNGVRYYDINADVGCCIHHAPRNLAAALLDYRMNLDVPYPEEISTVVATWNIIEGPFDEDEDEPCDTCVGLR